MEFSFDPVVALCVLKNLELAPKNTGAESVAFQNRKDISEENQETYLTFLEDKEWIESDGDEYTITPQGRIVLRQAEILVLTKSDND